MKYRQTNEETDIDTITNLIGTLELQQHILSNQIKEAKEVLNQLKNTNKQKPNNQRSNTFDTGDRVQIINPRAQQQNKGNIISRTTTGYFRIHTDNGKVVRQLQHNIIKLQN